MVAACKCTGPISKEPEAGIAGKQEDSHHLFQTKETKEGRTLYYAAVLVSVTLIHHSTKTRHTSMNTSCFGPGPLKPTVP